MIASFDHTISRDTVDHSYKMRWWDNNGTRVYSYAGSQEDADAVLAQLDE